MAPNSHVPWVVDHPRLRRPFVRPAVCLAAGLGLAACAEPGATALEPGDAGATAVGSVTVHTEALNVPALVSSAKIAFGVLEAESDREPSAAASVPVGRPLALQVDDPVPILDAVPATYGAVRLVAIDSLTLTSTTGNTLVIDFATVPPIELRCAGPGTYLPVGGQITMHLGLDLAAIQSVLMLHGEYPITLPVRTITDPALLDLLYTTLEESFSVTCTP